MEHVSGIMKKYPDYEDLPKGISELTIQKYLDLKFAYDMAK